MCGKVNFSYIQIFCVPYKILWNAQSGGSALASYSCTYIHKKPVSSVGFAMIHCTSIMIGLYTLFLSSKEKKKEYFSRLHFRQS